MRSIRPLRLEALEDRCTPTVVGVIEPTSTLDSAPIATGSTQSGAFVGGLMDPNTPADPGITPPPDPTIISSLGGLMDPIGTPVNP
jgi:hypothetical protein